MIYPGDSYTFTMSMVNPTGADPNVTSAPVITILSAATGTAVSAGVTAQPMTLISGTKKIYTFAWTVPANQAIGEYIAIVSAAYDTTTLNSTFLEKIRIGDSRVTGAVALDGTVAKDSTVAKAATTAKATDLSTINPANSSIIQAIKSKTDLIPAVPATDASINSVLAQLANILDAVAGSIVIDKTVSPNTLSIRRIADNTLLYQYQLTDDVNSTHRTKV